MDKSGGQEVTISAGTYEIVKWKGNGAVCRDPYDNSVLAHGDQRPTEVACSGAWNDTTTNKAFGANSNYQCGTYGVSVWKTNGGSASTPCPSSHGDARLCNENCVGEWDGPTTVDKSNGQDVTISAGTYEIVKWKGTGAVCRDPYDNAVLAHGDQRPFEVACSGAWSNATEGPCCITTISDTWADLQVPPTRPAPVCRPHYCSSCT